MNLAKKLRPCGRLTEAAQCHRLGGFFGTRLATRTNSFRPRLEVLEDRCVLSTPNVWQAAGPVGVWSDSLNWSAGHVPNNSEVAVFTNTSQATCIIDVAADVSGINIESAHTGAISAGANVTLGPDGFIQAGGMFAANSFTITDAGDWSESNTTGFNAGAGIVDFKSGTLQTILDLNTTFNNLTHSGSGTLDLSSGATVLTLTGNFSNSSGIVDARGTSLTLNTGKWTDSASVINLGTVTFSGSLLQTISSNSNFNNLTYSGTNTLRLLSAITLTRNLTISTGTFDANNQNMIVGGNWRNSGTVLNTATVTFTGGGTQQLDAGISPLNSVVHSGAGTLVLVNNALIVNTTFDNTLGNFEANGLNVAITGLTTISAGAVQNSGAADLLALTGGLDIHSATLATGLGTAVLGAGMSSSSGSNATIQGNLDLGGANRTITVNTGSRLVISAAISNGGISKAGNDSVLLLTHANSYTGGTFVNGGYLAVAVNGALGPGTGGTTVASGATLILTNNVAYTTRESVTLNGGQIDSDNPPGTLGSTNVSSFDGTITLGAAGSSILVGRFDANVNDAFTLNGQINAQGFDLSAGGSGTMNFNAPINGTAAANLKLGSATFNMNVANSFGGGTAISGSAITTIHIGNDSALGMGTITLFTPLTITAAGGSHTLANDFNLMNPLTVSGSNDLTLSGTITGSGLNTGFPLTDADTGTLTLTGSNTYPGATTVTNGTLQVTNNSSMGSGFLILNTGAVLLLNSTSALTFTNPLTLSGASTIQVAGLSIIDTWAGLITGTGGFTFISPGPTSGELVLTADNTYSGPTTVNSGILLIAGMQPNSAVTINSGGNLFASGTVGALTLNSGGNLAPLSPNGPGTLPAILTTGNLQLNGGIVHFVVNGLGPGTGYSQLLVNGTVNLGAGVATLQVSGTLKPQSGDKVRLTENLGTNPINGSFAMLPEGTIETDPNFGRILFTYKGGDGNDFVVTSVRRGDLAGRVSSNGQWWLGTSNGSAFANSLGTAWNPSSTWVDVQTGDFNGDGFTDIAGRYLQTGQWWVSLSNGSGGFTTSLWTTWNPAATWVDVKVGDFNGDGKTDIVGRVLQTGQWWIAQSTGSSFTNSLWATWNPAASWVDVQVADFNGDGKADITGRYLQGGQWWTAISSGSNFSTSLWTTWNPAATWVDVRAGDFNGDGKADIIGRVAQNGVWWMGTSTGTSFANLPVATWSTAVTWVDVMVGDFNGDGHADLVGRVLQSGQIWVSLGAPTANGFTTSLWATWNPAATWVDVQVGDFNGDGKSDITGRYLQGGSWWTGVSSGSGFTTSQWGQWNPAVTWVDIQNGSYA
jgi:autotransporter-associated beta strand protein